MTLNLGPALLLLALTISPARGIVDRRQGQVAAAVETRIGTMQGTDPDVFGRVDAVEVDGAGRVYVLETMEQHVRVFDRSGVHIRTFGRKGAGPGEFRSAVGLAWAPDGTLWIPDPENGRVSVFDTSGAFVTSHRMSAGFALAPWPGRFDKRGNFYHYALSPQSEWSYNMVKYGATLEPLDTLVPPFGEEHYFEGREERGGPVRARIPFSPRMAWRLSSDGEMWGAWTSEYEVFRVDSAGKRDVVLRRSVQPVTVTSEERDNALERLRGHGLVIDASSVPRRKPAIRSFMLDDEDRVWVIPELPDGRTGTALDVFSTNGQHLGRVQLPFTLATVPTPVIQGWRVYGVERDELGVESVVVALVPELGSH